MPNGSLVLEIRTANNSLPVDDCTAEVTDENGNELYTQTLNQSNAGLTAVFSLESPDKSRSLDPDNTLPPYSIYDVRVKGNGFYNVIFKKIQIFESMKAVLTVEMLPLPATVRSADELPQIELNVPKHLLYQPVLVKKGSAPAFATARKTAVPAVNILSGVFIPESITVHLGAPEAYAQNVTVPFVDYIKNVACSEIYPTWPDESLKANIIAQISLALNRIYTEWYPSKGYNFDITNSTAYDQYYVYGRNIFSNIDTLCDRIFNNYLVKSVNVEPYYAEYCNGTTSTCPGLSQWGTVALAENGASYDEILEFYYGDVRVTSTNDIREIEESYPGIPLARGSSGENVRVIQEQLARIAVNFPQIGLVEVNSVYDQKTENVVKAFQSIYNIPPTGIVDKGTWYRISYIYTAVKKLSELTSEGQRASYNERKYPGYQIRRYMKGSEVQEIQFYLNRINLFNPAVLTCKVDGIFGEKTEAAVKSFQAAYGLPVNGIVDEATWNKLINVYTGTTDNVDTPIYIQKLLSYPGVNLRRGLKGPSVKYVQELLNVINDIFVEIPTVAEDSSYGPLTEAAVNVFKGIFGLRTNGVVDEQTWNRINDIYVSVASRCIFSNPFSPQNRLYPGTVFARGSTGEDVSYIQRRLNVMSSVMPKIPTLEVDGIYGIITESAVKTAQSIFGLTPKGTVDQTSWALLNYIYVAISSGCIN